MSFKEYYANQAGSGIATYSGFRYQKGHGFFGRMIKGSILPLIKKVLPFLKDQLLDTGVNFSSNLMESGSFKDAAKKTAKKKLGQLAKEGLSKVEKYAQDGSGFNKCGLPLKKRKRGPKMTSRVCTKGSKKRSKPKGKKKTNKKKKKVVKKSKKGYKRKQVDMAYVRSFKGKKTKSRLAQSTNF